MGVRLPAEYQEVEYIQSHGTEWINTGFSPTIETEVIIDFSDFDNNGVTYAPTFGLAVTGSHFGIYKQNSTTRIYTAFGNKADITYSTPYDWTNRIVISQSKNGVFENNTHVLSAYSNLTFAETAQNIYVFARSNSNGNAARIVILKLYGLQINDNGIQVRNYIPCYRKSDNKPGLYDLVTKAFFTNAGTGEFTVGPDVIDSISPLMVAWRRIMMAAASVAKKLVKLIATSTTGLVSFDTNVEMPTKVTCEFSPIQEGTGDPSPDNVRPISGWTGCEIAQTGYNLLNLGVVEATPGAYVDNKRILEPYKYYLGIHSTSIAYYYRGYVTDFSVNGQSCSFTLSKYAIGITFLVKGGTRIKGTLTGTNVTPGFTSFFDKEWNVVGGAWSIQNGINVPTNAVYAMARVDAPTKDQLSELTGFTIAYETGNVEMQPFDGETFPINWQSEAGTVYGGTVTLNEDGSADLAVTRLSIEFDGSADEAWKFETTANHYKNAYIAMPSTFKTSQISSTEMICSASPTSATKSGTIYRAEKDACYISSGRNFNFCWLDTLEIFNANDFKAWLQDGHSLQVVATLINPITYHFPNIGQLNSFSGQNNIWHDMNGSITAEYYKKQ